MGLQMSFVSAAVPYGQRFINTHIPPGSMLAEKFPRYKKITIIREHRYTGATAATTPATLFPLANADRPDYEIEEWVFGLDVFTSGAMNYPTVGNINLYMYSVFLSVSLHNIMISKIIYKMIKIKIYGEKPIQYNSTNQTISIVDFKFPVEYCFFGL
jgi:hypothetical protein